MGELQRLVAGGWSLIRRRSGQTFVQHAPAEATLDRFVLDLLGAERATLHGVTASYVGARPQRSKPEIEA